MSFVQINQPNPPGQPQPYVGTPYGGSDLRGGYAPIRTTPGRMTNRRLVENFHIREFEYRYHEGIGQKHPVFMLKKDADFDNPRKIYDIYNLPTLNYILATMDKERLEAEEDQLTAHEVKRNFTFLGINNTDHSESLDAQADGPTHSITHQGDAVTYNIFGSGALHGLDLYFLIVKKDITNDMFFVFDKHRQMTGQVTKNSQKNNVGYVLTSTIQVIPYACFGEPALDKLKYINKNGDVERVEYGSYWKVGKLHNGIYMEEESFYNDNENKCFDVGELENTTDINIFVNSS